MRIVRCSKCKKIITLPDGSRKYQCKDCSNYYIKQWRDKNRPWCLFKNRSRRLRNRDNVNEYFRQYYNNNKTKLLENQRKNYRIRFPIVLKPTKLKINKPRSIRSEAKIIKRKLRRQEKENFYQAFENWIQP